MNYHLKIKLSEVIPSLALFVYLLELIFPKFNTLLPSNLVCVISFFIWILFTFVVNRKFYYKSSNIIIVISYIYFSFYPLIFNYNVISHRYSSFCLILCGSLVFKYYYQNNKLYILKHIIINILIFAAITLCITLFALLQDSYISRSIKSNGEYSNILSSMGVGGYSFVYFIAALSPCILFFCLKTRKKKLKLFTLISYLICFFFIVKANYMTAFLSVIVSSCVLLFYNIDGKFINRLLYLSIILIIILIFSINYSTIFEWFQPYIPSRISSVLFPSNNLNIVQSIINEFLVDRWPLIISSLNSFVENPFLGLLGSMKLGYGGEFLIGFGQHSYIIDTFSLYGIFGGILNLYLIFQTFKNTRKYKCSLDEAMLISMSIIYLLNNATESIALVYTLIYPLLKISYIENKNIIIKGKGSEL